MAKVKVEAECSSCGGTGVYHGLAEPRGIGVVCSDCEGSGKVIITFKLFTKRKKRKDIRTVRFNSSTAQKGIRYKDFLEGKMPSR